MQKVELIKVTVGRILNKIIRKLASCWIIKNFLEKNYYFSKKYKYTQFYLSHLQDKKALIIYQMGKVGSSTVMDSLNALALDMYIYHVHVLTHEWIDKTERIYKNASKVNNKIVIDNHLVTSFYLRKKLDKSPQDKKWKVVTLIRDPIARNISSFFEAFEQYFPDVALSYKNESKKMEDHVEELVELFLKKFNHDTPLIWFDEYMKPVFGIDVFSSEFPISKGFKIYEEKQADLLLIRLENLTECLRDAFRDFLNIENIIIKNTNISSRKMYYTAYRKFIESIELPDSYLNKMYTSKYVQHFYSQEEIEGFKAKWCKKSQTIKS